MSDHTPDPEQMEEVLLGVSLLESLVDPEKEELFEELTDNFDMLELLKIHSQLAMFWLMTEARYNEQTPEEYIKHLRRRIMDSIFYPPTGDE